MDGFLPTFIRRKCAPPTFEQLTRGKSSSRARIPDRVVLPLQDAPSAPYETTTQVGEHVRLGQKIGLMGKPPIYIHVHASISGKVEQIGPLPHPLGFYACSVSIVSDSRDERCGFAPLSSTGFGKNKEGEVFEGLKQMGSPLNYSLLHARRFKVSNLLINATEFEPYITSKHQMIQEHGQNLIKGLQVLISACSARQALILLEKDQAFLIKALKEAAKEVPEVTIRGVDRPYPETAKALLVQKFFSKKFNRRKGSDSRNTMSVDLSSLFAIYNAWFSGTPFTEQLITIAGSAIRDPQNIWVKTGVPLMSIVQNSVRSLSNLGRVTVGGPLMGTPQHYLGVPLIKKAKGIFAAVAFSFDEHRRSRFYKRSPCVKCAKCVDICPVSIVPNIIVDFIDNKQLDDADRWGVLFCVECGLCEYVCPSRIPLLELMKLGKVLLRGEGSLLTRSNLETLSTGGSI